MKKLFVLIILSIQFVFSQTEWRITANYLGDESGLRKFYMNIEKFSDSKWKWYHRCTITTGRNFGMATVVSDTNYSVSSWNKTLEIAEIKIMVDKTLDEYMNRLDGKNPVENLPKDMNSIDYNLDNDGYITIQLRGKEGDKLAYVSVQATDNSTYVLYNKYILPYSNNMIYIGSAKLKSNSYLVDVSSNVGTSFNKIVTITK